MGRIIFAIALCLSGAAASAQTTVHTCEILSEGKMGWIPHTMVIAIPDASSEAIVSDTKIEKYEGQPKRVRFNTSNQVASWTLKMRTMRGQTMRVRYRAKLSSGGRQVRVTANLPTRQRETSTGTCATAIQS